MASRKVQTQLPRWVRAIRVFSIACAVPAAVACLALMVNVIVDVAGRNFFNHPLPATIEATRYWWMMTLTFAALGATQVRGEHIRATVIPELLDESWQRGAEILATAFLGLLALVMAFYGWQTATKSLDIGEVTNSVPALPIWPFLFFIPLGCIGLALQCVASIYAVAAGFKSESHAEELI